MNGLLLASDVYGGFWAKFFGIDGLPRDGEIKFDWDFIPANWVLTFIVLGIIALIALVYRMERRDVGIGAKLFLTAFRVMLFLIAIFMFFGPHLVAHTIEKKRSYVVVLIDNSSSMKEKDLPISMEDRLKLAKATGISDDDILDAKELEQLRNLTRAEVVKRVLQNKNIHLLDDLESKMEVRYFTFSNRLTAHEDDREALWKEYDPSGSETAVGEAMQRALYQLKKKTVVPVIIFSDFKNNTGIDPVSVARQFNDRYVSVYTVLAGIPQTPRDIALLEPEGDMAVLAKDKYKLDFKIQNHGYGGKQVTVDLWVYKRGKSDKSLPNSPKEIEELITKSRKELGHSVVLNKSDKKQIEHVAFHPQDPGEYLLILKIEPREGESTTHNNYLIHPLRVADDKIKVLYVEGPPRYEYRFLKNALIRDSKILAHCFLTSADEGFTQEYTKGTKDPMFQAPLKEFPSTLEQLVKYDVVILGDVDPARLGGEEQWENLETFVTEFGGGLILISGFNNPRLFMDKPALRRLVPVELDPSRSDSTDMVYDRRFGYALTADALGKDNRAHHPIILYQKFALKPEQNQEHWEDNDKNRNGQIGIRWFIRTRGLAQNASPLVTVKGTQGDSKRPPLFVIQYNGRGRVFWSGTDETWLWRYLVGDYPWFYPFWQQAMYWVRQGKLLGAKRYRIDVDKDRYMIGQPVKINATAYDKTFRKLEAPKLTVFVEPPEGKRIEVVLTKDKARDGYYEGVYQPTDPGSYKIWAGEEDERTRDEDRFDVEIPSREKNNPILDVETATEIANTSYQAWKNRKPREVRDQFYSIDRVGELAEDVKANPHNMRTHPKKRYLWDIIPIWLLFALLITMEWVLRKMWRML